MMPQTSQLSILRILYNGFGAQTGVDWYIYRRGSVGGEVVEIYVQVFAAACEYDLLRLFWDRGGRR
jgi:hypothetical protein